MDFQKDMISVTPSVETPELCQRICEVRFKKQDFISKLAFYSQFNVLKIPKSRRSRLILRATALTKASPYSRWLPWTHPSFHFIWPLVWPTTPSWQAGTINVTLAPIKHFGRCKRLFPQHKCLYLISNKPATKKKLKSLRLHDITTINYNWKWFREKLQHICHQFQPLFIILQQILSDPDYIGNLW